MLTCKKGFASGLKFIISHKPDPRRKKMKFQKKMIILTTAAVATIGLIACGATVADSKKDDEAAVKPMAMKSAVLPNFVFIRLLLWISLQLQPLR